MSDNRLYLIPSPGVKSSLFKGGFVAGIIGNSVRLIAIVAAAILLLTGCTNLIIHSDDNVPTVAAKVTARTINCVLTVFYFCASEWWFMEDAKQASLIWYGSGNINADNYQCQQEASAPSSGGNGYVYMPMGNNAALLPINSGGGKQINQQLYYSCMQARGYSLMDRYEYNKWQPRQIEYQRLVAEKNALDDLKRTLDEQHRLLNQRQAELDQHHAALPGGIGADQYEKALASYHRDLTSYNQRLAEYTARVELLNKHVASFNK